MQYWIDGTAEPLTLRQIHDRKHLLSPATRCAAVGSNEWKPIQDIIPDLFGSILPTEPKSDTIGVLPQPSLFSRDSGWVTFFYVLAVLNVICGILIALLANPVVGIVAGLSSVISCLFFAYVSQILVDIRWLLSKK
jgi:hypothetical protein